MKYKLTIIAVIALAVMVTTCTSCTSNRQVQRLKAQHVQELHNVNNQLTQANDELLKQTEMLDSLMGLPAQVDTIVRHTERIIDNTDSLVIINNNMLRMLHRVEWNTDTIIRILRQYPIFFDDKF